MRRAAQTLLPCGAKLTAHRYRRSNTWAISITDHLRDTQKFLVNVEITPAQVDALHEFIDRLAANTPRRVKP